MRFGAPGMSWVTVVDASAVIDLLVPRDRTQQLAIIDHLPAPGLPWLAPDVIAFDVLATVRRHRLRSLLDDASASRALDRFLRLPIEIGALARAAPGCVGAS